MLLWTNLLFLLVELFRQCVLSTATVEVQKIALDSTSDIVTITSPGFESGSYPVNTVYKWELVTEEQKTIQLSFDVFQLEYHKHCLWDYVRLSDVDCLHSSAAQSDRLCGTKFGFVYNSSANVLCVEFVSDVVSTRKGFKATAKVLEEDGSISNEQLTTIDIDAQTSTSSLLSPSSSKPPSTEQSPSSPATLPTPSEIPGAKSTSSSSKASQTNSPPSTPSPEASQTTQVSSSVSTTNSPASPKASSSTISPASSTTKTSPVASSIPSTYSPTSSTVEKASEDVSRISTSESSSTTTQTTSSTEDIIYSQTPSMTFGSSGPDVSLTSPSSSSVSISTATTNGLEDVPSTTVAKLSVNDVTMVEGKDGEITVDGYSEILIKTPKDETGNYPVNFHSVLVVNNLRGLMLTFTFDYFRVEYNHFCSWDFLLIHVPNNNHRLCGTMLPNSFDTDLQSIKMEFHSDVVFTDVGFALRVAVHHPIPSSHVPAALPTSSMPPQSSESSTLGSTHSTMTETSPTVSLYNTSSTANVTPSLSSSIKTSTAFPSTAEAKSSTEISSTKQQSTSKSTMSVESTSITSTSTPIVTFKTSSLGNTIKQSTGSLTTPETAATTSEHSSHETSTQSSPETTELSSPTNGSPPTPSLTTPESTVTSVSPEVSVCDYSDISLGSYGEIIVKSPTDGNGKYPVNVHCMMNIRNFARKNLKIKFTEFRLEQNSLCAWDYLILYTPVKHGPLCGYHPPSEMITQSDTIGVEFRSDVIIPDTGFIMKMIVLDDNASSVTELTPTASSVTSTSSPQPSSGMPSTNTPTSSPQTSSGMPSTNTPTSSPQTSSGMSSTNKPTSSPQPSSGMSSTNTPTSSPQTSSGMPLTNTPTSSSTAATASHGQSSSTPKLTSPSTSKLTTVLPPSSSTISTTHSPSLNTQSSSQTTAQSSQRSETTPQTSSEVSSSKSATSVVTPSSHLGTSTESLTTLPTSFPDDPEEIDICSRTTLEFNNEITIVSPGFSNGQNYPLNTKCDLSIPGLSGEKITVAIEAFNVEQSSTCNWDALVIQFGDERMKLCGFISQTYNANTPCSMGSLVQYDDNTNTRICFLDSGMSHTFEFTSDQTLLLRFVSDHVVARNGFRISLKRTNQQNEQPLSTSTVANTNPGSSLSELPLTSSEAAYTSFSSQISSTGASTPVQTTKETPSSEPTLTTTSTPESTMKVNDSPTYDVTTNEPDISVELVPFYDSDDSNVFSRTVSTATESTLSTTTSPTASSSTALNPSSTIKKTNSKTNVPKPTSSSATISSGATSTSTKTTISSSPISTSSSSTSATTDGILPPACSSNGKPFSLSDDMGFIESPRLRDRAAYPPNITCRWKIEDLQGQMISLIFEVFDIEKSSDCRWDKLGIYETYTETNKKTVAILCGDTLPHTITAASDVLIEFKSDNHGENTGFRLKFLKKDKIYEDPSFTCLPGMTTCLPTQSCIPVEWICDGEIDCPDMLDEVKCVTCKDTEFPCGGGLCINQTQRCDGYDDCPYGLDEQDCVYMEEDNNVRVIANGKPLPLCYSSSVLANGNLVCRETLSRMATNVNAAQVGSQTPAEMAVMTVAEPSTPVFKKSSTCTSVSTSQITCKDNSCGRKTTHRRRKRVVGGRLSKQGEWPWSVALRVGKDFSHVICGGTIIDKEWVMTAGHCVKDLTKNPQIASIIAGVKNIYDVSAQTRYVTEVVLHPDYHYIFNADIALLKLDRPLIFNEHVQQICLPWDRRQFSLSSRCFIAGWGISDMAEYYTTVAPKYLRHAKTKLVSLEYCNSTYATHSDIDVKINENMICAGYSSGAIDACKGDSGGGLMCETADGRWVQAGVTSWGDLCGSTNKPGVYTKVVSFVGWINETLGTTGNSNVNCSFETGDWCGYQALSNGTYIWTRKPIGNRVPGHMLYAIRADVPDSTPANATLITPQFNTGQERCVGFQFLFSGNSNITLSVYGVTENSGPAGHNTKESLLWRITSHYPASESWQTSEADVPDDVSRLKFVSLHEHGGISGLGLDNVTLRPAPCSSTNFMKCNFNQQNLCQYTNPLNTVFNKHWKIKHRSKAKGDYVLETGGNYSSYGYMAVSQLVSPEVESSFASLPHCLTFSFYKEFDTQNELKIATYSKIGQQLTNQRVFWSSQGAVIGQWNHVKVAIFKISDYFDHIVLEVRRSKYDNIYFMVDNLNMYDGYCV